MTEAGLLVERPRAPFGDLGRLGAATALVSDGAVVSYAELAERVAVRTRELGGGRRLVAVRCRNDVETVVSYLAGLSGGHVVLLTGPDSHGPADDLLAGWSPDVVVAGADVEERCAGSAHTLHPDLALLMSTSGSTGSPKLVRLSHDNLRSNAASIVDYLGITASDRAATTLPLHYCYGLSVLNSHLLAGASLLLTERSVVDDELWADFQAAGATSFAGVPHTFDLLDTSGFAERRLPTLRYVTQAGGRLAPERVRAYARLGRERGFDLVVMYGQTEATARMAYLPPHLAEHRPDTVGIPIPGGGFRLDPVDHPEGGPGVDDEIGELVYTGPNVMLGYATEPADLADGRTTTELRTGDLARQHEDGLYEVVGRRSRFAKVFGLRIDLDRVEWLAAEQGVRAVAVDHGDRLALFVTRHLDLTKAREVAARCGLPRQAVVVAVLEHVPMTGSDKPDYAALRRHAAMLGGRPDPRRSRGAADATAVRDLYAELLGRPDATEDDSFSGLRGDSLSYVEVSLRLGDLLGRLPRDWPRRSARELAAHGAPTRETGEKRRRGALVDTSALLRALAIVLVVGTHANLLTVMGGAHLLLGVAGYNLARFQLTDQPRRDRMTSLLRAAATVAVPSALWILLVTAATRMYDVPTALMLNGWLGSDSWDVRWQFWFLEALVWTLVGVAGLLAWRRFDAFERRRPYFCAMVVLAGALALRFGLVGVTAENPERYTLPVVVWCIALGWLVARSSDVGRRVCTSVIVCASTYDFFGEPLREALVAGGLLALTWAPQLRCPRLLSRLAGPLAASSLFVYLTHWQVYPYLEMDHPLAATVASFAVGMLVWKGYSAVQNRLTTRLASWWPPVLRLPVSRVAARGWPGRRVTAG